MWLVAGAVLLVLLNLPDGITQRIRGTLREGIAPLQELVSRTTQNITKTTRSIKSLGELLEENKTFEAELVNLRSRVRILGNLELENHRLRQQLDFSIRSEVDQVGAEVIGRDISGWWQTLRINKGQFHGLSVDRAVITPEGVVGRTVDVSLRTTDVLLLTDPNCHVSAVISRVNGFGILTGQGVSWNGNIRLKMKFINRNLPIQVGDEVETSGLGGVFPKGLRIGQVESINPPDVGLHQEVEVRPSADFGAVEYVFVESTEEDEAEALLIRRNLERMGVEQ